MEEGIDDSRLLNCKYRYFNIGRVNSTVGIEDVSSFDRKSSRTKLVRRPVVDGIDDVNRLNDSCTSTSRVINPNVCGMVEDRAL